MKFFWNRNGNNKQKSVGLFMFALVALVILMTRNVKPHVLESTNSNKALDVKTLSGKLLPLSTPPASAEQVTIGIYPINIYELSTTSNTYYMSAYVWLRWKGNNNPIETLEFTNSVETWGLTKTVLLKEPKILSDESKYQILRIEGRFFQAFDLKDYPLDKQELSLFIEDTTNSSENVVYLPDTASTSCDASLKIPGWQITDLKAQTYTHDYGTNFGEINTKDASKYSCLKFSLEINRYRNFFLWKLLLPMLIVLITNWLALLLKPTWVNVRTVMPSTALLTLVFLQQNASNAIAGWPSLVLMDKLYVVAYSFISLTLLQIMWVNSHLDEKDLTNIARMKRIDLISFLLQIMSFTLIFYLLLLL